MPCIANCTGTVVPVTVPCHRVGPTGMVQVLRKTGCDQKLFWPTLTCNLVKFHLDLLLHSTLIIYVLNFMHIKS